MVTAVPCKNSLAGSIPAGSTWACRLFAMVVLIIAIMDAWWSVLPSRLIQSGLRSHSQCPQPQPASMSSMTAWGMPSHTDKRRGRGNDDGSDVMHPTKGTSNRVGPSGIIGLFRCEAIGWHHGSYPCRRRFNPSRNDNDVHECIVIMRP